MRIGKNYRQRLFHFIGLLIGRANEEVIEYRILNAFTLLNGSLNIIGSYNYFQVDTMVQSNLFYLQFVSGIFFFGAYFLSRIGHFYKLSFYFFMTSIFIFLAFNIVWNGGLQGGAHYYMITAILIGTILSPGRFGIIYVFTMALGISSGIFFLQYYRTDLVINVFSGPVALMDLGANFIFTQILNGVILIIFKQQFNAERKQSERLLLNILPQSIADELRREGQVKPISYSSATILFTDFVGFTKLSASMSHNEVFIKLNILFSEFDKIVKKYPVEKIKTIGDAYMLAGGVPEKNKTHHLDVALVGLAFRQSMERLSFHPQFEDTDVWKIRIGIHTGPIMAGVVGSDKFVFDIWSDAVNVASRIETASEANKINISEEYYQKIRAFFECQPRGKKLIKGKGEVSMYFLEKLKDDFKQDELGYQPNRHFWQKYRQLSEAVA